MKLVDDRRYVEGLIGRAVPVTRGVECREDDEQDETGDERSGVKGPPRACGCVAQGFSPAPGSPEGLRSRSFYGSSAVGPYIDGNGTFFSRR
jgi:hypothetical protein